MKIERSSKKLHRVKKNQSSDWENIAVDKMNSWQRIAHRTKGVITIGNAVTLTGSILVIFGLAIISERPLLAAGAILLGRIMDYYDGILADMTKTKSSLGALFDETADMILLGISLIILGTKDILPLIAVLAIGLPKAVNAISSIVARLRRRKMFVTAQSKVGTAVIWLSIGTFILGHVFESLANTFQTAGWVILVAALALSIPSTIHYAKIGLGSQTD